MYTFQTLKFDKIKESWYDIFDDSIGILASIDTAITGSPMCPKAENIFRVFETEELNDIKVVILGQDPYYNGQADGLAFSTMDSACPKSLGNIYKEIKDEYPDAKFASNDLTCWAKQGVFLFNTLLTTVLGTPKAHLIWKEFTSKILNEICKKSDIVYMLWGKDAQAKINCSNGLILYAAHPSPLSATKGFFGCGHFVKCNDFLESKKIKTIDWSVT
jgi:uracil-DNA glycosylase